MDDQPDTALGIAPPPAARAYDAKQCARCGREKPMPDFNHRQRSKDGKQSYCRDCQDDDRLQRFYHFSRQERDLMYARQRGQCRVCHALYPHLSIYAVAGVGVISLVCPRCMRILHGFNRHPDIITSANAYLDYFSSKALYGVEVRFQDDWEARHTGEPQRRMRRRQYPRGVNPETYDHWLLLNEHTCYICREPCPTGRKFAKDHHHVTDRNRGLLCVLCNMTLGIAQENTDLLKACAAFLQSYLAPYIAGFVSITDTMIADAAEAAPWVSRAYSTVLSAPSAAEGLVH